VGDFREWGKGGIGTSTRSERYSSEIGERSTKGADLFAYIMVYIITLIILDFTINSYKAKGTVFNSEATQLT
jgi:hypothetical protein